MLSKRGGIGLGVGGVIIAIGLFSLIQSLGLQTIQVDDTYEVAESTTYEFNAPQHAEQFLNITGNAFHVNLKSPRGGIQIPGEDFKNELSIQWFHLEDGISRLEIQNTGDSELHITGTLQFLTDFIQITYHIMVIIAGLVIVGFSAAFSVRKPRGF